jgi:hypothetical protein
MQLGHLLTRSGLTHLEVSSKVCHDFYYQLGNSVSLPCVINYGAFYLRVVSSFSYIPVICPKLVLFLISLQFVHFFCNQSKCILLFFSPPCIKLFNMKEELRVSVHRGLMNKIPTRCNKSSLFSLRFLLYMFRALHSPIPRSLNCTSRYG